MKNVLQFLAQNKYELLLFGLLQHTFMGIFFTDLDFYTQYIWPINMVVLALSCFEVFNNKNNHKRTILNFLVISVCLLPIIAYFVGFNTSFMSMLSIAYVIFFGFVFAELLQFLIRPSYVNKDVISASICGYLLLIEIMVFLIQTIYYFDTQAFKGLNEASSATIFIDLLYFSTITITSIGFGDITPQAHQVKLLTALFGIVGQFYSVVLVGILISKFTSRE